MLIGIIEDTTNKVKYYIDLENKDNTSKVTFTMVTSNSVKVLSIDEIKRLFKLLLSSKLHFKEKYNDYDVYLDEAGNKRFFKNGKENLLQFLNNNGVSAISCFDKSDKKAQTKRYKIMVGALVLDLILAPTSLFLFIENIRIDNSFQKAYYSQAGLNTEEVMNLINSSKYLSDNDKKLLCNKEYIDFVLENSDSSRNYDLRRSFSEIRIETFDSSALSNADGYYDPLHPNTIYILDKNVSNQTFYQDIIIHEYIHTTQCGYPYIKEASDEMFKNEYFNKPIVAYHECIKRIKVLMEIIGTQPVINNNFKANDQSLDNEIEKYLSKEDAETLIELFNTPSTTIVDPNANMGEINSKIDELLAKIYFNKTGKNIKDDEMINLIYEQGTNARFYFNKNKKGYYDDYLIYSEKEQVTTKDLSDILALDAKKKFVYTIVDVDKSNSFNVFRYETYDFSEIPLNKVSTINIEFDNGTIGFVHYDQENASWDKVELYKYNRLYEPSIPNKFPDQERLKK